MSTYELLIGCCEMFHCVIISILKYLNTLFLILIPQYLYIYHKIQFCFDNSPQFLITVYLGHTLHNSRMLLKKKSLPKKEVYKIIRNKYIFTKKFQFQYKSMHIYKTKTVSINNLCTPK